MGCSREAHHERPACSINLIRARERPGTQWVTCRDRHLPLAPWPLPCSVRVLWPSGPPIVSGLVLQCNRARLPPAAPSSSLTVVCCLSFFLFPILILCLSLVLRYTLRKQGAHVRSPNITLSQSSSPVLSPCHLLSFCSPTCFDRFLDIPAPIHAFVLPTVQSTTRRRPSSPPNTHILALPPTATPRPCRAARAPARHLAFCFVCAKCRLDALHRRDRPDLGHRHLQRLKK